MNTWIALLRGINVVGKNKLPMKELAAVLEDAGFKATRTYIQSGNVVFRSARRTARTLSARIEKVVLEHFGFALRVAGRIYAVGATAKVRAFPRSCGHRSQLANRK